MKKLRCYYSYFDENKEYYRIFFDIFLNGELICFDNIEYIPQISRDVIFNEIKKQIDTINSQNYKDCFRTYNDLVWYLSDHLTNDKAWDIENSY